MFYDGVFHKKDLVSSKIVRTFADENFSGRVTKKQKF